VSEFQPARRFLILDDEESVGAFMEDAAADAGLETRFVRSADAFWACEAAWQPTHIAVDLVMPQVDGVEVLQELAQRNCHAKIIIMSGAGMRVLDAARRAAVEQGLDVLGVLLKPFTLSQFHALMKLSVPAAPFAVSHAQPRAMAEPLTRAELSAAIEQRALFLVYQPKIRCADQSFAGAEALVRWQHPTRGIIPPVDFVPFAESCGLIDAMTKVVFEMALRCHAMSGQQPGRHIAINLSAVSLGDHRLPETLVGYCQESGVDPGDVVLEVTETAAMVDHAATVRLATRLRLKGFQLSIDDAGVGYSSLAQLARLPFSELKVDAAFVQEVRRSGESRKIVRAMIGLGHSLDMKVTAEGVSDSETLAFLAESGCDFAQGYFIARPMLPEALHAWRVPAERLNAA